MAGGTGLVAMGGQAGVLEQQLADFLNGGGRAATSPGRRIAAASAAGGDQKGAAEG